MSASTIRRTKFVESRLRFPAENLFRFGGVADEKVDFRWTFVARVMFDEFFPIEIDVRESGLAKFAHRVRLVSRQDKIVALSCCSIRHIPSTYSGA